MKHEFGSLAKHREEQVVEWAMEHPTTSFSGDAVCKALFGKDRFPKGFPDKLLEAYRVACEDLRRKQILKGVHGKKVRYALHTRRYGKCQGNYRGF